MRHEEEEKRAKEMLREEEGTGRKGRLGIDLESGVVVIGGDDDPDEDTDDPDEDTDDPAVDPAAEDEPAAEDAPERPADARKDRAAFQRPPAGRRKKGSAQPGVPQVATRSPTAVPSGKARRNKEGNRAADGPTPTGKTRRTG
jgi:hypothetical protein